MSHIYDKIYELSKEYELFFDNETYFDLCRLIVDKNSYESIDYLTIFVHTHIFNDINNRYLGLYFNDDKIVDFVLPLRNIFFSWIKNNNMYRLEKWSCHKEIDNFIRLAISKLEDYADYSIESLIFHINYNAMIGIEMSTSLLTRDDFCDTYRTYLKELDTLYEKMIKFPKRKYVFQERITDIEIMLENEGYALRGTGNEFTYKKIIDSQEMARFIPGDQLVIDILPSYKDTIRNYTNNLQTNKFFKQDKCNVFLRHPIYNSDSRKTLIVP